MLHWSLVLAGAALAGLAPGLALVLGMVALLIAALMVPLLPAVRQWPGLEGLRPWPAARPVLALAAVLLAGPGGPLAVTVVTGMVLLGLLALGVRPTRGALPARPLHPLAGEVLAAGSLVVALGVTLSVAPAGPDAGAASTSLPRPIPTVPALAAPVTAGDPSAMGARQAQEEAAAAGAAEPAGTLPATPSTAGAPAEREQEAPARTRAWWSPLRLVGPPAASIPSAPAPAPLRPPAGTEQEATPAPPIALSEGGTVAAVADRAQAEPLGRTVRPERPVVRVPPARVAAAAAAAAAAARVAPRPAAVAVKAPVAKPEAATPKPPAPKLPEMAASEVQPAVMRRPAEVQPVRRAAPATRPYREPAREQNAARVAVTPTPAVRPPQATEAAPRQTAARAPATRPQPAPPQLAPPRSALSVGSAGNEPTKPQDRAPIAPDVPVAGGAPVTSPPAASGSIRVKPVPDPAPVKPTPSTAAAAVTPAAAQGAAQGAGQDGADDRTAAQEAAQAVQRILFERREQRERAIAGDSAEQVREILERRLREAGVSEPDEPATLP